MTFQELYTSTQLISGDSSATTLIQFKKDINQGNRRFNAALNNYFTRRSKVTDLVEGQQYYQLPPDAVRITGVDYLDQNGRRHPLAQSRSEYNWRMLNTGEQSGDNLLYYFVQGSDEIGLYPIPASDMANGLIIYYEPRGAELTQDDYTTGTVSVTEGSVEVTGTGTTFTPAMAGRVLRFTDASSGFDYWVSSYESATELLLEEPFTGLSGAAKPFLIGESPVFPLEYHDCLVDYALMRFYEMSNNPVRAKYHSVAFDRAVQECKEHYASSSSSMVIVLDDQPAYDFFADNTRPIGEA